MSTLSSVVNDPVTREGNVFRGTNRHKGRKVFITPENSTMQHLCYARILLDKSHSEAQFGNGNQETALICLAGEAHVEAAERRAARVGEAPDRAGELLPTRLAAPS